MRFEPFAIEHGDVAALVVDQALRPAACRRATVTHSRRTPSEFAIIS
jgi:hypothetical protein